LASRSRPGQRCLHLGGRHIGHNVGPTAPASRTHAYTAEAVSDDITDALSRASTEELLLELRRRIIRPRYRRQDWDDGDGLDASGGWPEEG
jgi:hypothetical protein